MEREVAFPPGFQVFNAEVKEKEKRGRLEPVCTLGKSGYLTFNQLATSILLGPNINKPNEAVFIAYNARTRKLALRPVPYHLKSPVTYKIVSTEAQRGTANVAFKTQARAWQIPLDRTRSYVCHWDAKHKLMIVEMSVELRAKEEKV